jgi:hypothetical protein
MKMPKETYRVTLNRHPAISVKEMSIYVKEAIECWSGQDNPDGVWFYTQEPVTVKRILTRKKK